MTLSLLMEKDNGDDPLAYRFFCLQSHYRKALVFSWENLDNAQGAYQKLISKLAALKPEDGAVDGAALDALRDKFKAALDNDLNTALAVTALYDVLKAKTTDATKKAAVAEFDTVLGLGLIEKAEAKRAAEAKAAALAKNVEFAVIPEDGAEDPEVTALLLARRDAKKAKNFAEADRIRDELAAKGIALTDIPNGVKWKKS